MEFTSKTWEYTPKAGGNAESADPMVFTLRHMTKPERDQVWHRYIDHNGEKARAIIETNGDKGIGFSVIGTKNVTQDGQEIMTGNKLLRVRDPRLDPILDELFDEIEKQNRTPDLKNR